MENEVLKQQDSCTRHENAMLIVLKKVIRICDLTPWQISQITDFSEDDINKILSKQEPLSMGFVIDFSTNILLKRTSWEKMVKEVETLLESGYTENSTEVEMAIINNFSRL